MSVDLSQYLVIGISSRALFDLSAESAVFNEQGLEAYEQYQLLHEHDVLKPGAGFPLVKAILSLNQHLDGKRRAEVVVMSRNSAETSLRIFNSVKHYGLDITRAALTGGAALAPYLAAFNVSLFLSLDECDAQDAINAGFAAALVYDRPENPLQEIEQIRIAFDGDAVLFSDESERIYQEHGIEAFTKHEEENAKKPLEDGPFAKLLRLLSFIQGQFPNDSKPIRTALVTARCGPSHERVIRTLAAWNVNIDEAFFLGGAPKAPVLQAFRPHMFFDDQHGHCEAASKVVATSRVPWRRGS